MLSFGRSISEDAIELFAIERLEAEGYSYRYGPDIAPSPSTSSGDGVSLAEPDFGELSRVVEARDSYEDVLLLGRVKAAIARLNPTIPAVARPDAVAQAIRQLQRLTAPDLIANNEAFHRLLTEGVPITYQKDGNPRGDRSRGDVATNSGTCPAKPLLISSQVAPPSLLLRMPLPEPA